MWLKQLWEFIKGLFSSSKDKPAPDQPNPTHPDEKPPIVGGQYGTGYKVDPPDPGDYMFAEYAKVQPLEYMPNLVDHSQFHGPVVSQGQTGSCVGQSMRSAYEYLARAFWKMHDWRGSSMYPYFNARALDGGMILDNGTFLRSGVKGADKNGNCSMSAWPFDASKINVKPPQSAYREGAQLELRDYLRCANLAEVKSALAQEYPVVIGIDVYSTLYDDTARRTGVVGMPVGNRQGGHAICLVGYDDYKQLVKFKNSWGTDWGDKGYGYLPYAYFDGYVHDMWCIRPKTESDPGGNPQ